MRAYDPYDIVLGGVEAATGLVRDSFYLPDQYLWKQHLLVGIAFQAVSELRGVLEEVSEKIEGESAIRAASSPIRKKAKIDSYLSTWGAGYNCLERRLDTSLASNLGTGQNLQGGLAKLGLELRNFQNEYLQAALQIVETARTPGEGSGVRRAFISNCRLGIEIVRNEACILLYKTPSLEDFFSCKYRSLMERWAWKEDAVEL